MVIECLIYQEMVKEIGGRWHFSAVTVEPPFLQSSILFIQMTNDQRKTLELSYEGLGVIEPV